MAHGSCWTCGPNSVNVPLRAWVAGGLPTAGPPPEKTATMATPAATTTAAVVPRYHVRRRALVFGITVLRSLCQSNAGRRTGCEEVLRERPSKNLGLQRADFG